MKSRALRKNLVRDTSTSNIRVWTFWLATATLVLSTMLFAQPSSGHFDRQVQAYVRNGDFSGSLLVAKDGRILFQKSYGMANYEWSVPNSEKTKFHIASITKTFTAAAILQLDQQGKLKLTDPLSKYIPDFLNGDRITIEQMLSHTSGLPDFYSLPEYSSKKNQRVTLADLIAWVKTKPLDFLPGSKSSYSNTGYAFLAYIVEQVAGKSYDEYLAEAILKPVGLKDTGPFRDDTIISNRATGYQPAFADHGLRNAPAYDKTILTGSGSLYSTALDLYEWCRAAAGNRFFNIHDGSRAYGWGTRETKSRHKYIEQSGRDPGFSSHLELFPDDRLIVVVLGNLEDAAVKNIADDLAAIALGEDPAMPAPRSKDAGPTPHPEELAGTYEVNPKFLLDIRVENSKLYLRGTGGDFLPLEPTGKDTFFYRQLYVKVEFKRDKSGKIEALLWNGDYPCKKLN